MKRVLAIVMVVSLLASVAHAQIIDAGSLHSLIIKDGTVWAWGNNSFGQLGDGTTTQRTSPVHVEGLSGVIAVTAGNNHSIAINGDSTVWAWGYNFYGQLGDGTTTHRASPVHILGLDGVIAVTVGGNHSMAIKDDGTVWAWGYNFFGQLGDGTTTQRRSPVQIEGLNGVVAVAAGQLHSVAIKDDGTVWAWGDNSLGQLGDGTTTQRTSPVHIVGLDGVIAVTVGGDHSMAIKGDGTVWAWGDNSLGQLGDGTITQRTSPVQVMGLTGVQTVTAGDTHSMAIKGDGTAWAWGNNSFGQLGDGTKIQRNSPVQVVAVTNVIKATLGSGHSMVVKGDGTVWAWGYNQQGQLGDGTNTDKTAPVQVQIALATEPTEPSTPIQPSVASVEQTRAIVSWQTVNDATKYRVYVNGVLTDETNQLSYMVTDLWPGTNYTAAIDAGNDVGWSGISQVAEFTTIPAAPAAPTVANVLQTSAQVTWQQVTGATRYRVLRDGVQIADITEDTYNLTGLAADTGYSITIRAGNASGWSEAGAAATFTTAAEPVAPPAPTVSATATQTSITLQYSAPGAEIYRVYYQGDLLAETLQTSYTISGLTPDTEYTYTITALAAGLESEASGVTTRTTAPLPPPTTPIITTAKPELVSVTLEYYSPDADSYRLYKDGDQLAQTTATKYTVRELEPNQTYTFGVTAVNNQGESELASIDVTTQAPTPGAFNGWVIVSGIAPATSQTMGSMTPMAATVGGLTLAGSILAWGIDILRKWRR